METVLITGIKGQIASYAADKFLSEGYKVVGVHRRCATPDFSNIEHILDNPNFILHEADICDMSSMVTSLQKFKPSILLSFAAMSHVGSSYNQPIVTAEVDYLGVATLLEAVRLYSPKTKFWNANTSERYGNSKSTIQDENTLPSPVSPYAVAKVAAEYLIKSYRDTYGLHASFSIMFNSESPRRGKAFVTRKITDYIGRSFLAVENSLNTLFKDVEIMPHIPTDVGFKKCLDAGIIHPLKLGNLDTYRSWTHCKDTVDGIYKQVMLDKPDDFVLGREETHSIREFLTEAFNVVGISDWTPYVVQDQAFMRPSDVPMLRPTCTKAKTILGWQPKITFKELVTEMVKYDCKLDG